MIEAAIATAKHFRMTSLMNQMGRNPINVAGSMIRRAHNDKTLTKIETHTTDDGFIPKYRQR